ncbi:MAG: relaxase domain-containing protein [Oligoflexales bacterium]|nr:relaxase domain-containing protein [Oligoflexales bacterium]
MLSLANVSAAQAVHYYSSDNYYTKDLAVENSQWWGKGAQELGLAGNVFAADFEHLLQAKDPRGNLLMNKSNIQKEHQQRAGIDLTFSAPKSVTLASLKDKRLLDAHQKAVNSALEAAEESFSYVRRGKTRDVQKTGNLVVAQFHHDTSRKSLAHGLPDPQIHTHCVALNMTKVNGLNSKNDKWMTLLNDGFYNNSKLIGLVYQNELAKETKRLGYQIEINSNGTFDIKGYNREQIAEFSKRTAQISALKATSKKEERQLKMMNRIAKGKKIPRAELEKHWLDRCEAIGIKHPQPLKPDTVVQKNIVGEAIKSATLHLAERDVSFSENKTISYAFSNHLGDLPSYNVLKKELSSEKGLILHTVNRYGEKQFTTQKALLVEKEILNYLQIGKGSLVSVTSIDEVNQLIQSKQGFEKFTKGQEDGLRLVASTTDQISGWQGVAGSGKSYALMDFRLLAEGKGHKVIGMAPDAEAVKVLSDSTGIADSRTVASFLQAKANQPSPTPPATKHDIWIIDEAGKLNAKEAHELLKQAAKQKTQVLFVGDTRQLSAVGAGNPFKLLQDNKMAVAHLNEHRRQKKSQIKAAVERFSEGKVTESLEILKDRIKEEPDQGRRIRSLVKDYMALSPEERDKSLVLSGTNHERLLLTQHLRKELKKDGQLGKSLSTSVLLRKNITEDQGNKASSYEVGDIIMTRSQQKQIPLLKNHAYEVVGKDGARLVLATKGGEKLAIIPEQIPQKLVFTQSQLEIAEGDKLKWTLNHREIKRNNGQEFRILEITDDKKAEIVSDKGRRETIDLTQPQFLDHSLVSTAYSSQGKKADHVFLLADKTIAKESMYVALSRSVSDISIYCENFNSTLATAQKTQAKKSAFEIVPKMAHESHLDARLASFSEKMGSIKGNIPTRQEVGVKIKL